MVWHLSFVGYPRNGLINFSISTSAGFTWLLDFQLVGIVSEASNASVFALSAVRESYVGVQAVFSFWNLIPSSQMHSESRDRSEDLRYWYSRILTLIEQEIGIKSEKEIFSVLAPECPESLDKSRIGRSSGERVLCFNIRIVKRREWVHQSINSQCHSIHSHFLGRNPRDQYLFTQAFPRKSNAIESAVREWFFARIR